MVVAFIHGVWHEVITSNHGSHPFERVVVNCAKWPGKNLREVTASDLPSFSPCVRCFVEDESSVYFCGFVGWVINLFVSCSRDYIIYRVRNAFCGFYLTFL